MICSVPLCNVSRMDSNDLDSPGKRLKWAREKAGFQQAGDFAKRVGVHPTTYRAYENDQNGFAKKVHEFAERLGVTGAWLMRGGDIEPRPVEDMPLDHQARQLGLMLVPELELGYSMGGGSIFNDYRRTGFVPFHREWLRSFARGSLQDLFVARGEGDSMTPTLLDGDIVLIDTAPEGYWAAGPHLGACIWRSRDDQESPPLTRWNLSPQVGRRGPVHGAAVTHPERPGLRLVRPQGRDHALQHGCHGRLACARRVHHIQVQAQQDQRRGRGRVAAFRQG